MTVYKDADHANMLNNQDVVDRLTKKAATRRRLAELPLLANQCFDLLDDMQRITNKTMTPEEVGSIRAKLTILRINLNVHFGVNTPQLD
jgi:hypothetical protein